MMLAGRILSILAIGFGFLTSPLQAQIVDTVCAGARGEEYRVIDQAGSSFSWKVDGGAIISGQKTSAVKVNWGTDTGVFEITVQETNSDGCPGDIVQAFVWVRGGIEVDIHGPTTICKGEEVMLTADGGANFKWSTGFLGRDMLFKPSSDTTVYVIGTGSACGIDTGFFQVKVFENPQADLVINPPTPGINEIVEMSVQNTPASELFWRIPEVGLITEADELYHTFTKTGLYTIQALLIDDNGCRDTVQHKLEVSVDVHVYTPNAFTPDGDDLNARFAPVTANTKSVHLQVFNRWGENVYEAKAASGSQLGWDGNYNGVMAPEGIYVYKVQVVGLDDKLYTYEGTVQLIR
ncbi:MAG: gliding motility-associated C-terminal domain-containing protein [Bacteroidetes bacterium]|nr:MAG: gliding motility-associated C-terminal domain-containing protein [Bacteroidota bacterium]